MLIAFIAVKNKIMATASNSFVIRNTDQTVSMSADGPKLTFDEWFIFRIKNNLPCKVIGDLPCRPLKEDDFCSKCFNFEFY